MNAYLMVDEIRLKRDPARSTSVLDIVVELYQAVN